MSAEDVAASQRLADATRKRRAESLHNWLSKPEVQDALKRDMLIYGTAAVLVKNDGDCLAFEVADPFNER